MLPIMNTDLDLTSRKDTKIFVFELCMKIYKYPEFQTNFQMSYVASLGDYVCNYYDLVPYKLRAGYPLPR